ncbi:MAG: lipocalin family protein [Actinobacteria bacterium]|nr:lipocalin family protein [Actinomycetota bacterium]
MTPTTLISPPKPRVSSQQRSKRRLRSTPVLAMAAVSALLGLSACTMSPSFPPATSTVASVDLNRYLGTWYEVGSVKQFFSIGLVNTKAQYSLNPNGTVRVENSGNYFGPNGPQSRIVGSAAPVDPSNARLNVAFVGTASTNPPGNYWIVDLDPDYQWAIVSDPSGASGFLLTRSRSVSPEFYDELVSRAAAKGVNVANLTRTPQL